MPIINSIIYRIFSEINRLYYKLLKSSVFVSDMYDFHTIILKKKANEKLSSLIFCHSEYILVLRTIKKTFLMASINSI